MPSTDHKGREVKALTTIIIETDQDPDRLNLELTKVPEPGVQAVSQEADHLKEEEL